MGFISYFMDNYTASIYDIIVEYVDTEYSLWLTWFLMPVIVTFLLPAVIIVLIYISAIIFHLYRLYRMNVVDGVQPDWKHAARLAVCALWDAHGWLWHGYDIKGLENIPDGPFLVIYYHGALPIDMYYFIARMLLFKRRHIHTVADRFMFKIPGWATLLEGLCVIPGTVQTCASVLRNGNPLAISPGGVYEAQFGDHYYRLNWRNRIGFAKVAQEAKVPIVPMFTQNVREAFRTVGWLRGVWLKIYATFRMPLAPVYGGFPVKLITHLGKPIPYDPELTPEQLQRKESHYKEIGRIFNNIKKDSTSRKTEKYIAERRSRLTEVFTKASANHSLIEDQEILEEHIYMKSNYFGIIKELYKDAMDYLEQCEAKLSICQQPCVRDPEEVRTNSNNSAKMNLQLYRINQLRQNLEKAALAIEDDRSSYHYKTLLEALQKQIVTCTKTGTHRLRQHPKSSKADPPHPQRAPDQGNNQPSTWNAIYSQPNQLLKPPRKQPENQDAAKDDSIELYQMELPVAHAIEDLVEEHQRIPGSILQALLERVHEIPKRRKEPPLTNGKCQNGTLKSTEDSEKSASGKSKVS
ncbi:unnamed protein product [Spodoptera exigua]|nr:unnamed protein product [Spodoptera exigua]